MHKAWDCIVVGAGPAGLTAAIYLARFHLSVLVIDAGGGRARSIPCTRNMPGFPDGIAGSDLVDRMRAQAVKYGVTIEDGRVDRLDRALDGFVLVCSPRLLSARTVLLAT